MQRQLQEQQCNVTFSKAGKTSKTTRLCDAALADNLQTTSDSRLRGNLYRLASSLTPQRSRCPWVESAAGNAITNGAVPIEMDYGRQARASVQFDAEGRGAVALVRTVSRNLGPRGVAVNGATLVGEIFEQANIELGLIPLKNVRIFASIASHSRCRESPRNRGSNVRRRARRISKTGNVPNENHGGCMAMTTSAPEDVAQIWQPSRRIRTTRNCATGWSKCICRW